MIKSNNPGLSDIFFISLSFSQGFKALVVQADELEEIDDLLPQFEKGNLK